MGKASNYRLEHRDHESRKATIHLLWKGVFIYKIRIHLNLDLHHVERHP